MSQRNGFDFFALGLEKSDEEKINKTKVNDTLTEIEITNKL